MKLLDNHFQRTIESCSVNMIMAADSIEFELSKLKLKQIILAGLWYVQEGLLSEHVLKGE